MPFVEEAAKFVFHAVVPPPVDSDPQRIHRWRWSVATLLLMTMASLTFHIALACGFIPILGFSGFAQASDLQAQQQTLMMIQAGQVDSKIVDARSRLCELKGDPSQAAKIARRYTLDRLNEQLEIYRKLTGQNYPVPSCEEL